MANDDEPALATERTDPQEQAAIEQEPSGAEPEAQPQPGPPFDNLAETNEKGEYRYENILKNFRSRSKRKYDRYVSDRQQWDGDDDGIWAFADFMYRCGRNSSQRASVQSDDTNADTASTLYFRQVRAISAYLTAIYNSQKDPAKFSPLRESSIFRSEDEAARQAEFWNKLMRWTRARNNDRQAAFDFCNLITRYGAAIEMVQWKRRTATRSRRVPVVTQDGTIERYDYSEERVVVDNQPERRMIPLESLYADIHVGDLQRQQDIVLHTQDELGMLWDEASDGDLVNIDKITAGDYYKGESDTAMHRIRQENRGLDQTDATQTGLVNRFDCWMKAPIAKNEAGEYEWDEKKNKPVWWWATFAGNIESGPCLCLRRNYDPEDEFPGQLTNLFPDDQDLLYHLSPAEVIKPVWDELTTKKNQAIDNVTLQNRRPLKGIRGEVFSRDLAYAQDAVLWVERPESLTEMQVASNLGDTMGMVNYLEEEANRALSTDKPFMGYALGSRTSATEANNVFQRAMQPAAMLAEYVFVQREAFFMRKAKGLWEKYALPDQVIEIAGEPEPIVIQPATLFGDYDVEVTVVDQFMNDALAAQNMNYLLQAAPNMPNFAQDVDTKAFLRRMFELYKVDMNPGKYIRSGPAADAEKVARMENYALTFGKMWDEPQQGEDHATHLKMHKAYRLEFTGLEQNYPPEFTGMLDQHIKMTEFLQQQEGAAMQSPAVPMNETPGEVAGNALAAPMGAMNMGVTNAGP